MVYELLESDMEAVLAASEDRALISGLGSARKFAAQVRYDKDFYVDRLNMGARSVFVERFSRGVPGINADLASGTEATREPVNQDFEVLGTNMTSALSAYDAGGGCKITTAGADLDQAILCPHLDTKQTGWSALLWSSNLRPHWHCNLKTGTTITSCVIWAGLKKTNTPVVATDLDQCFFRYENGVNSGKWQCVYSINDVDVAADSGVTVVLSSVYRLSIIIDSARVPRFYINGRLVKTGTALTTAITQIPYAAVQASTGASAAKSITVRALAMSQDMA